MRTWIANWRAWRVVRHYTKQLVRRARNDQARHARTVWWRRHWYGDDGDEHVVHTSMFMD